MQIFVNRRSNIDFLKVNAAVQMEDFLPRKKLVELEKDQRYKLSSLRIAVTKYGNGIIADIG